MEKSRIFVAVCSGLALLCAGLAICIARDSHEISRLNARIAELEDINRERVVVERSATPAEEEAVAASFDGGIVTAAEASAVYAETRDLMVSLGMDDAESLEAAKEEILNGLVEEKILIAKAKEYGVYEIGDARRAELEAESDAEYEALVDAYAAYREGGDVRAAVEAYLAENDITREGMRREKVADAWKGELRAIVAGDAAMSEEALQTFYEENATRAQAVYEADFEQYELDADCGETVLWHPEGVRRVDALLVPFDEEAALSYFELAQSPDADGMDELYAPCETEAAALRARIDAGESFENVQQGRDGGTLYIGAQSSFCGDAVRDAALALEKPGDISAPVRSDAGVMILRYAGDVPAGRVPLEDIRDALNAEFIAATEMEAFNAAVGTWLEEAHIVLHPETF